MRELLCFQHCDRDSNVFCFSLPNKCPICGVDLNTADLRIPPFRVPIPFTSAEKNPMSIVVKPTTGNFIRDFKNGDLLHAGFTNSTGKVYEFDETGIHVDTVLAWKECLAISMESFINTEILDKVLDELTSTVWMNRKYDDESSNCFDFVLSALERISVTRKWTKTSIVLELISPSINKAIRIISLYRKIEETGIQVSRTT